MIMNGHFDTQSCNSFNQHVKLHCIPSFSIQCDNTLQSLKRHQGILVHSVLASRSGNKKNQQTPLEKRTIKKDRLVLTTVTLKA